MLNIILIVATYSLLALTFFIVTIWKKKNFVKEVYIEQRASIVFYAITVAITIGLTIAYFLTAKGNLDGWKYWVTALAVDIVLLVPYAHISTACIYLEDNVLVKRNIFFKKQIKLDRESIYKETGYRRIVQSQNKKISIWLRYDKGNLFTLIGKIKEIIN